MFRTPHMKTCVHQLRFHRLEVMLRDTRIHHERAACSRSSSVLRGDEQLHGYCCSNSAPTSPRTLCSISSSVVLDTSEHIPPRRICISTPLLLTHMNFSSVSWIHTPKTSFLFLHAPSQCPTAAYQSRCLPPESKMEKCQNSPESNITRQTCILKRSTNSTGRFQWLASIGLWSRRVKAASRSAELTLQTRGLHRDGHQRAVADECLSAGNEARCRRSLQANAALYERERKSWAAVLVCLCAESGDPALLFTLRSAQLKGRHKGDVSFAGGKKDPSDRSVVDTALREAREELGIHISEDKVWGVMKPLRDASGMMIAPVIANLGPLEMLSFRPNPSGGDFYPDT
ncbi:nucleoside diphosphate-linked moiety X motif 8 isoform X2 [Pseudorasbora parva]|uniref:nucleoside diphosphate-linked moiety X motif 8 isoform X2 n=1 Tax=Pseudorasbora parva TaxID=51549 RepID=UPI00351DB11A